MQNIRLFEENYNIKFPTSYIQFVLSNNYIENKKYKFIMDDGGHLSSVVLSFLSLNEQGKDYILNVCKEEKHLEPNNIIPIARTDWDFDFICLYFENGRNQEPKIIYFSFDLYYESLEDAIFYVANTFDEFIPKLNEV